ncbi:MAG TPA: hypothetical protein VNQ90_04085 [Chthoniobacteraceae bacterium]|nr:hypothetical protein [Chthoniobacteraceae bacterium]
MDFPKSKDGGKNPRNAAASFGRFQSSRRTRLSGRGGFSLLMVVVTAAIVAVLMAFLFPVLTGASASARATRCVSNLKQLGIAFLLYTADHNGKFPSDTPIYPSTRTDRPGIRDYTGATAAKGPTIWTCPELQAHPETATSYEKSSFLKTYTFNRAANSNSTDGRIFIQRIPLPAELALVFDGSRMPDGSPWNHAYHEGSTNRANVLDRLQFPHQEHSNVCFLDGHVEPVTRERMLVSDPKSLFWWGGSK